MNIESPLLLVQMKHSYLISITAFTAPPFNSTASASKTNHKDLDLPKSPHNHQEDEAKPPCTHKFVCPPATPNEKALLLSFIKLDTLTAIVKISRQGETPPTKQKGGFAVKNHIATAENWIRARIPVWAAFGR